MRIALPKAWRLVVLLPALLLVTVPTRGQKNDQAEVLLQSAINKEMVDGNLEQAIDLYKKILANYSAPTRGGEGPGADGAMLREVGQGGGTKGL